MTATMNGTKTRRKRMKKTGLPVPELCAELQTLQKRRSQVMGSLNMQRNRLRAIVAIELGYNPAEQETRERFMKLADAEIDNYQNTELEIKPFMEACAPPIFALEKMKLDFEYPMKKLAQELPVFKWVQLPEQKGFSELGLAIVIGETGNLSNYSCPTKVHRRMGCEPYCHKGETHMASTWRMKALRNEGGLPKEAWSKYGYVPRRRSISYNVADGLIKQNKTGPYRTLYLEKKAECVEKHPDWNWSKCDECKGKDDECEKCQGTGVKCRQAHRHAGLIMTKRLLRNLWYNWTGFPDPELEASK